MSGGRAATTTELGAGEPVVYLLHPRLLAALERAPLFHALSRSQRKALARLAELRHYGDGADVVRAGERGVAFYVVLQGDAQVVTPDGRERRLHPGDHFGELSLLDDTPRSATVTAAGPLTTGRIVRRDFSRLLRDDPSLTVALLPGLVLVIRDLMRAEAQRIPDLARLSPDGERAEEGVPVEPASASTKQGGMASLPLLRRVALFCELPERQLRRLAKLTTVQHYADGSNVMVAGATGDSMHVILEGGARVRTPGGHTRTLDVGDCFGELALLDGGPRSASIVASGELTTARIRRVDFRRVLHDDPVLARGLLNGLVRTVRDMQQATGKTAGVGDGLG